MAAVVYHFPERVQRQEAAPYDFAAVVISAQHVNTLLLSAGWAIREAGEAQLAFYGVKSEDWDRAYTEGFSWLLRHL